MSSFLYIYHVNIKMRDPLATNQQKKTKYKSYFHHVVIVYRKHTKLNTSKESLKKKSKKRNESYIGSYKI